MSAETARGIALLVLALAAAADARADAAFVERVAPLEDVVAAGVDARGRAWILRTGGAVGLARLDDDFEVVERVPMTSLVLGDELFRPLPDGSWTWGWLRLTPGGLYVNEPFLPGVNVLGSCGDRMLVSSARGVEVTDASGVARSTIGRYGPTGTAGWPSAGACGGGRIALVVGQRIDVHADVPGHPYVGSLDALAADENHQGAPESVSLDAHGRLYAHARSGFATGSMLHVHSPDLRPLAAWPLDRDATRAVADPNGRVFFVAARRLHVLEPVPGALDAAPESRHGAIAAPATAEREVKPVTFTARWEQPVPLDVSIVPGTPSVTALAFDPDDPLVLWMTTSGGLVRLDRATGEWRHVTPAQGIRAGSARDLDVRPDGVTFWSAHETCRVDDEARHLTCLTPTGASRWMPGGPVRTGRAGAAEPPRVLTGQPLFHERGESHGAFEWIAGPSIAVPGSDDVVMLHQGDVLRLGPGSTRAAVLANAASLLDATLGARGAASRDLIRSIAADRWGPIAWVAADGVGLTPLDLRTGALGCAVGPAPSMGWSPGTPFVGGPRRSFAVGNWMLGEVGAESIDWRWRLLEPSGGPDGISDAVLDPLDSEVLWLGTPHGPARLDARTGALDLVLPSPPAAPSSMLRHAAGRTWGWTSWPRAELRALDERTGEWRPVAGLPSGGRLVGEGPGRRLFAKAGGSWWAIDSATLRAEPWAGPGEAAAEAIAVADDGRVVHSLRQSPYEALCRSSGGAAECEPFDASRAATGEYDLALNRGRPGRLLLATARGLVEVDPATGVRTRLADGAFSTLEVLDERHVFVDGGGGSGGHALLWDTVEHAGWPIHRDHAAPDPLNPREAWVRSGFGFHRLDVASRTLLHASEVQAPVGRFRVTAHDGRRTAWVECCGGLARVGLD